jgi:hypothetical protein
MKNKQKIVYIYIASILKIIFGIVIWITYFNYLPGNLKIIIITFLACEFIERVLVHIHEEQYRDNYWEADINRGSLFFLTGVSTFLFWVTYLLIIYYLITVKFSFWSGLGLSLFWGVLFYFCIYYLLSKRIANTCIWVSDQWHQIKVFNENLKRDL